MGTMERWAIRMEIGGLLSTGTHRFCPQRATYWTVQSLCHELVSRNSSYAITQLPVTQHTRILNR